MDKKEYSNGEITVIWKADKCIHSGNCVRGLPNVFKPKERPWIQLETANTEEIKNTVDKCPSGALSYVYNNEKDQPKQEKATCIQLVNDGPLIVDGHIELEGANGNKSAMSGKTALCRCGASDNKPFCDGSHKNSGFKS